MSFEKIKSKKGITLIALVITIIVLLILAGVSIATLTGDNGLLAKTQQAKEENEKASDRDKIAMAVSEAQIGENGYQELNSNNLQEAINNQFNGRDVVVSDNGDGTFTVSCLDTLKDYKVTSNGIEDGIDWNEAMANAVTPESQDEARNEGVIGIGTDGNPVDMDLWEYTKLDDGTYSLLSADSLDAIENKLWNNVVSGYKGSYDAEGKISGTIPNYISTDNGNNYIPVTSLSNLFRNCTELKIAPQLPITMTNMSNTFNGTSIVEAPIIPSGVTDMNSTFQNCAKLTTPPKIPNGVTNMQGTFFKCSSLETAPAIPNGVINMYGTFQNTSIIEAPEIPNSVTNMENTFQNCTSLIVAPDIPNGVQNMSSTFDGCTNLETPPTLIPSSVTDIRRTFKNCYKLSGTIQIEADITGKIIDNEIDCKYCFALEEPNKNETDITLTGDKTVLNLIINNSFNNTIHIE